MKLRRTHALIALIPLALLLPASTIAAPVVATPTPGPAPTVQQQPKMILTTEVTPKNVIAIPGETKTFQATLTAGGNGVAGKTLIFISGPPIGGGVLGTGVTDAQGVARISYTLPEVPQGAYGYKVRFQGDDGARSSQNDANISMVKGITKVELGDLIWGTYQNEPGPKTGTIMIKLVRPVDGKALNKQLTVTVNGKTWNVGGSSTGSGIVMLPLPDANAWNVKAQFFGDDANLATQAERTYSKPAGG